MKTKLICIYFLGINNILCPMDYPDLTISSMNYYNYPTLESSIKSHYNPLYAFKQNYRVSWYQQDCIFHLIDIQCALLQRSPLLKHELSIRECYINDRLKCFIESLIQNSNGLQNLQRKLEIDESYDEFLIIVLQESLKNKPFQDILKSLTDDLSQSPATYINAIQQREISQDSIESDSSYQTIPYEINVQPFSVQRIRRNERQEFSRESSQETLEVSNQPSFVSSAQFSFASSINSSPSSNIA